MRIQKTKTILLILIILIIYIEKETDDAVTASAGENVRPSGIMHTGSEKETAAPQTSY